MNIYEKNDFFHLLGKDEMLPQGAKLYQINFSINRGTTSREVFPQFEMRISFSKGRTAWDSDELRINFKKKMFAVKPLPRNLENYLIRLLNDLNKGDYEYEILKYIKDGVTYKKYLEIKSSLKKLSSPEEIALENYNIKNELEIKSTEIRKLEEENKVLQNLNVELKNCKKRLAIVERKLANNLCYKISSFLKLN